MARCVLPVDIVPSSGCDTKSHSVSERGAVLAPSEYPPLVPASMCVAGNGEVRSWG